MDSLSRSWPEPCEGNLLWCTSHIPACSGASKCPALLWSLIPELLGFCCPAGHHPFQTAKKAEIPAHLLFTSKEVSKVSQSEPSSLLEELKSYPERCKQGCDREHHGTATQLEQPQSGLGLQSLEGKGKPRKAEESQGNQSLGVLLVMPRQLLQHVQHTDTPGLAVCADTCHEDLGRSSPLSTCITSYLYFPFPQHILTGYFFFPWCDSNTRLRRSCRGRICSVLGWLEPSVRLQAGLCFRTQPEHRVQMFCTKLRPPLSLHCVMWCRTRSSQLPPALHPHPCSASSPAEVSLWKCFQARDSCDIAEPSSASGLLLMQQGAPKNSSLLSSYVFLTGSF